MERKIANPRFVLLRKINDQTILLQSVPSYSCDSCDENFNTEADLIVHKTEQSILRTREALRQAEPRYKCDACEKTFSTKFLLMRHCATPCKYPVLKDAATKQEERQDAIAQIVRNCAVNKKLIENKTTKGKKKSKENKKSEEKKNSEENKSDENKESSKGSIECDKCDKCFKKRRYLKVHKTLHESPYICNICGSKLTSEYFLKIHIRRHNKEFTEFCEICNKGFYLRATLKNHMSVHTAEKPHVCEICNKAFGNRVYLRSHMQIHCKPEMRKTFKCEICDFQTFYSYCYRQHVWTHTGESQVACEVCGKLIRRQYMKIHMRIHTGEKPDICEFCGKAFSSRKYLIKHRRIHTGEKPYQCKICKKSFTQRGTLTLHLRRHEDRK
ncbi:zinc finger protein 239-like [Pseudomyrmex gracilis]|uniref:zinc finger protein 239-like n=1 Tax=Pseudomyrmex gracilis TaxID=219809 RepID=UPI000995A9E9|nr:zinc finger protein 239-like [Pseudomyrmex gracilis]XP_020290935.1 zinc finger protein 239-like [Pseudomyrmex gracilis]XP_020290936.1 zinc finger protein 239-like [Pseudomyrmex gracilis]